MKFLTCIALLFLILNCASSPKAEDEFRAKVKNDIRTVVRKNRKNIIRCHDKSLKVEKKKLYGKIRINWYIQPTGEASKIKVISDTIKDNGRMAKCITGLIEKMKFPLFPENPIGDSETIRDVIFPFVFSEQ